MKQVIMRLRESKRETDQEMYEVGLKCGRCWVEGSAKYVELDALEMAFSDPANRFEDNDGTAYSPGERLFFAIRPGLDGDRSAAGAFWEETLNEYVHLANDAIWVNGFIDGALEIWEEVKTQI